MEDYILTIACEEALKKYYPKVQLKFSKHFEKKVNRIFREDLGYKKAYYPEVDNFYEKIRSEILKNCKKRRIK